MVIAKNWSFVIFTEHMMLNPCSHLVVLKCVHLLPKGCVAP